MHTPIHHTTPHRRSEERRKAKQRNEPLLGSIGNLTQKEMSNWFWKNTFCLLNNFWKERIEEKSCSLPSPACLVLFEFFHTTAQQREREREKDKVDLATCCRTLSREQITRRQGFCSSFEFFCSFMFFVGVIGIGVVSLVWCRWCVVVDVPLLMWCVLVVYRQSSLVELAHRKNLC